MTHKPSLLVVCVHNAGRSQMAAGYLTHLAGDKIDIRSAGSEAADPANPVAVAAITEESIDITAEEPKILTTAAVRASDVVITMGCGDTCPYYPGNGTRTGSSTTLPAKTSPWCGPSATRSAAGSNHLSYR